MAEHSYVRSTKPVLKATKAKNEKEKSKEKRGKKDEETQLDIVGIWWTVTNFGEISGDRTIERNFFKKKPIYMHLAMDFCTGSSI